MTTTKEAHEEEEEEENKNIQMCLYNKREEEDKEKRKRETPIYQNDSTYFQWSLLPFFLFESIRSHTDNRKTKQEEKNKTLEKTRSEHFHLI